MGILQQNQRVIFGKGNMERYLIFFFLIHTCTYIGVPPIIYFINEKTSQHSAHLSPYFCCGLLFSSL